MEVDLRRASVTVDPELSARTAVLVLALRVLALRVLALRESA